MRTWAQQQQFEFYNRQKWLKELQLLGLSTHSTAKLVGMQKSALDRMLLKHGVEFYSAKSTKNLVERAQKKSLQSSANETNAAVKKRWR